ncbi:WD40 repeat-containing protein [Tieghemostelium lacteum]|uniref:WD40 repeat-containing protein n=1 Tax=Tieghemostelium lacteum TaxID=361077 RepID=A0A151ZSM0_TIELA|nr:WD40 repeat-containing protein [Tieghemostelium lacteum]|eukprot:KYQ96942.1 WD40 repeat-containing protein [Tieghemostelium lacteum]
MKFGFKFSNLLGTVYNQGNIVYTPDGNTVISPVGNRITAFDLVANKSVTLPFQTTKDIVSIEISPNGSILVVSDEAGVIYIINYSRQVILGSYKHHGAPTAMKFSPNGAVLAIGVNNFVYLYKAPLPIKTHTTPLMILSRFEHKSPVASLDWSSDSKKLLICCKNGFVCIRKGKNERVDNFQIKGSEAITCVFGNQDATEVYGVSEKAILIWKYHTKEELENSGEIKVKMEEDEDNENDIKKLKVTTSNSKPILGRWVFSKLQKLESFNSYTVKVNSAVYQLRSRLMLIGMSNGQFSLHEMPEYKELYKLKISSHSITTAAINNTGEWLAFGCEDLGQLLVWEWRSESYILKQQGHSYSMNALSYSSDGQSIATGGDDGKVKVWSTTTGYCFVTFSDHEAPVTAVRFSPVTHQNVLFSASLDGSVRAFDLLRYRNFRTFVSPNKAQFSTLAVDPSGEIVVAGTSDSFEIYVWSVRTGKLTDIISGHESAISDLAFDPVNPYLTSTSWDKTARVWNIFEERDIRETVRHQSEILACAYSVDGKKFVTSSLDGTLQIFETTYWTQIGMIDGRNDMLGVRIAGEEKKVQNDPEGKAFTKIAFTPDSECLIAGGNSNFVCIYHIEQQLLVKKFQVTQNQSMDGVAFSWKNLTEYGHLDLMEGDFKSGENRNREALPGVKTGDFSKRDTKRRPKTKCLSVSPTGRSWAAATTEGLLIYSLDEHLYFDPTDLTVQITPETILKSLKNQEYLKSLVMALKLNEKTIVESVFEKIPPTQISLVSQEFPVFYLKNFLQFLSNYYESHLHLELQLRWLKFLFIYHGKFIKDNSTSMLSHIRNLQKTVTQHYNDLSQICDDNQYTLNYFQSLRPLYDQSAESPSDAPSKSLEKVYSKSLNRMKKWKNVEVSNNDQVKEENEDKEQEQEQEEDKFSGDEDQNEKSIKKVKVQQKEEHQIKKEEELIKTVKPPTKSTGKNAPKKKVKKSNNKK